MNARHSHFQQLFLCPTAHKITIEEFSLPDDAIGDDEGNPFIEFMKGGNPPCTPLFAFLHSIACFCLGKMQICACAPDQFFARALHACPCCHGRQQTLPKHISCHTCKHLACDFHALHHSPARLSLLIRGRTAAKLAVHIQFCACNELVKCSKFHVIYCVNKIAFIAGDYSMTHD